MISLFLLIYFAKKTNQKSRSHHESDFEAQPNIIPIIDSFFHWPIKEASSINTGEEYLVFLDCRHFSIVGPCIFPRNVERQLMHLYT